MLLGALALSAGSTAQAAVLQQVARTWDWGGSLMHATSPSNEARLYIAERQGAVRIIEDGELREQPFLEIGNVATGGERGLQSIAFAPDYAERRRLYVFYVAAGADSLDPSGKEGDIRIVEYLRATDPPLRADPNSARLVLKLAHSATNHYGGQLAFGPDGLLYASIGDNADRNRAQELENLFGTIIRIDPRDPDGPGSQTYSVPEANPFAGAGAGTRREIFAYGLRNPFRFSFARDGRLTVADVGEGTYEEVNVGSLVGANLGWPHCEGFCSPPNPAYTDPFFAYPHRDESNNQLGCSVIGGHEISDPTIGEPLEGRYLYGDFCARDLRTLDLSRVGGDPAPAGIELPDGADRLFSFGQDAGGCSYVLASNNLYRLAAAPGASVPCPPRAQDPGPGPGNGGPGGSHSRADRLAPSVKVRLAAGKRQRLRRSFVVLARCSERCRLRATGHLRLAPRRAGGRQGKIRLRRAVATRKAGSTVRLRLRLTRQAFKRALRAKRAGRRVKLRIAVRASDSAGNATRRIRTAVLTRPARAGR